MDRSGTGSSGEFTPPESVSSRAGELCPDGYDFVGNNNQSYVGGTNGSVYGGTTTTLVVQCKSPATTKN